MEKKKNSNTLAADFYWLFVFSVLVTVLVGVSFYKQAHPEWTEYQQGFQRYLEENISPEAASAFDVSVKQIWLPELNRVDRCISCHLGYDNPNLAGAPEPFSAHPQIEPHSMQEMGCTICHGGQGFALKKKDAHGEIKHWEEPLLGKKLSQKYGTKNEYALMQINCNICHRRDKDTPDMAMINLAKKLLTQQKRCTTCHIIDGQGGKLGPDLTFVGDKSPERFDFSHIEDKIMQSGKPLSMLNWHVEHFRNPRAVIPTNTMPAAANSEEEALALAMLMMSWKNVNLPIMLIPKGEKEEVAPDAKLGKGKLSTVEWGKELFTSNYCSDCHTIGEGVDVGPDLLGVTERRSIQWLKRMVLNPEEMEETDPIAKQLYQEYDEVGMEAAEATEEEVEAIVKYIKSFDKN